MTNRRFFLLGAAAVLATPAIVRAESIMRVVAPRLIVPMTANEILLRQVKAQAMRTMLYPPMIYDPLSGTISQIPQATDTYVDIIKRCDLMLREMGVTA